MIRQITLRNWQAFRGEHIINLESKAYAITATYETDPQRSNWAGKSALLEAVEFALTGCLNKDRRFDADGWITRGEKEGFVEVVIDSGISISRERKRGKSTQVRMTNARGDVASQDEATALMLKHLAFDADDYRTVAYFPQGAMARLVRTEAEKRFDIVRGWFGLVRAEEAEEIAKTVAINLVRETQALRTKLSAIEEWIDNANSSLVQSTSNISVFLKQREELKSHIENLTNEMQQISRKERFEETIDQFEQLIHRGKSVAKEIEEYPSDLKERADELEVELRKRYSAYQTCITESASKHSVMIGRFDGTCPVAGITCPATKQINDDRSLSSKAFAEAKRLEKDAQQKYAEVVSDKRIITQASELMKKQALRTALREQAITLRERVSEARRALKELQGMRTREELQDEATSVRNRLDEVNVEIARVQERTKQLAKYAEERASLIEKIEVASKRAAVATQTRAIFRATQRRIAERALNVIGGRANDMLLTAGVDLSIDIQWEREGKGLARACEMCGMSFPTSAKVKECSTCGAERGQHIVQRLEFNLSDRSGAADDFAGIALQLAAGSWLLSARSSSWATAMIDEPFSQMDKTIRRAAARQLIALLGSSAFRQIFVISHSSDTLDMYPARLNIVVARDGTRRIEVM